MASKPCSVDGCQERHYGRGYCAKHYQTARAVGNLWERRCLVLDCKASAVCKEMCSKHYQRWKKHGSAAIVRKGGVIPGKHRHFCSEPGCIAHAFSRQKCKRHYHRALLAGQIHTRTCTVGGCVAPELAKGYCSAHWQLWKKYGVPERKVEYAKTLAEKRAKATARMQRYRATTAGMVRSRWARHKSRVPPFGWIVSGVTKEQLLALWITQPCPICGRFVHDGEKELDHIVPLSKGGEHRLENLQIVHLVCNRRKSNHVAR